MTQSVVSVPLTNPLQWAALQPFGAQVSGLDIHQATAAELAHLKQLLAWHGVVVLRGVNRTSDENDKKQGDSQLDTTGDLKFSNFLKRLGPMTFTVGETPVGHQPMLNVVSNMGRATPPKSVFHTDTSYVPQPPAYTALRPVTLPVAGGETVFSNQFLAYETLSQDIKNRLAGTLVLHRVSGLPTAADVEPEEFWHPLFKVHPLSGRTALFLSTPQRCQALSGVAADKARRIIQLLYRHSVRAHRLYHHRWHAHDWVLWDNRCTMHRGDHSAVVGDRVFHRGMVLPDD